MKKSVGIGIGIVIVATLIIVAFSNIDDLVSTNIEEIPNQISEKLDEKTSEVKFTNPLQRYEVDSNCKLAYVILDNIENNKGAPFQFDQEILESMIQESRQMYVQEQHDIVQ